MDIIQSINNIIPSVLRNLENPEHKNRTKLISEWEQIVGKKLATQTHPKLTKKGILYVFVKEPVLAYEISQRHRQSLLKRAQAVLGENQVVSVRVMVG